MKGDVSEGARSEARETKKRVRPAAIRCEAHLVEGVVIIDVLRRASEDAPRTRVLALGVGLGRAAHGTSALVVRLREKFSSGSSDSWAHGGISQRSGMGSRLARRRGTGTHRSTLEATHLAVGQMRVASAFDEGTRRNAREGSYTRFSNDDDAMSFNVRDTPTGFYSSALRRDFSVPRPSFNAVRHLKRAARRHICSPRARALLSGVVPPVRDKPHSCTARRIPSSSG